MNKVKGYSAHILLLHCVFSILLFGCQTSQKTAEDEKNETRPNIIFIIADDMYPDMFNCLPQGEGKNLSPAIDRLAEEGTVMRNQYVVSPVCTPSRYNVLTGNYASRATNSQFLNRTKREEGQTVIQWNTYITAGQKFLPHYLQKQGYTTGMVGKNHVIEVPNLQRFDDFNADARAPDIKQKVEENYRKVKETILRSGFDYAGAIYHNNPNFIGVKKLAVQNMDWIAQAGVEFIEQYHQEPFFLYFATTIPHGPTSPERSWKADPKVTARGYLDKAPDVLPARETLPQRIKEAGLEGQNKELVLWLDDAVGALVDKLEEKNILDNTIIFFFNDHGQQAKGTLYQGGVHNPSIVWRQGGFATGHTSMAKIQNIDFAPTILEYAGFDSVNNHFDGKSFKPVLEAGKENIHESMYFELGYARAVIKGDYKYIAIRYPDYAENMTKAERIKTLERYNDGRRFRNMPIVNEDPEAPFSHLEVVPGGGSAEHGSYGKNPNFFDRDQLYNLDDDPQEKNNLADNPEYSELLKEMKDDLRDYLVDLPGEFKL